MGLLEFFGEQFGGVFGSGGVKTLLLAIAVGLPAAYIFLLTTTPKRRPSSEPGSSRPEDPELLRSFKTRICLITIALGSGLVGAYLQPSSSPLPPQATLAAPPEDETQQSFSAIMRPLKELDTVAYITFSASLERAPKGELLYMPIVRDADGDRYAQFGYGFLGPQELSATSNFSLSKRANEGAYPMFGYVEIYELDDEQRAKIPHGNFSKLQHFVAELAPIFRSEECKIDVSPLLVECGGKVQ